MIIEDLFQYFHYEYIFLCPREVSISQLFAERSPVIQLNSGPWKNLSSSPLATKRVVNGVGVSIDDEGKNVIYIYVSKKPWFH